MFLNSFLKLEIPTVEERVDSEETTKYPVFACCNIKILRNEEVV
jgi:hypothetical protein